MNLFDCLKQISNDRGNLFVREIDWKKLAGDRTGYSQWVIVVYPKEIFKWVAWTPNRLVQGGTFKLEPSHFDKNWKVVNLDDMIKQWHEVTDEDLKEILMKR